MQIKEIENKEVWEDFIRDFYKEKPSNILQSWNWGDFESSLKRKVWRLGIYENDELIGICFAHLIPTKLRTHIYTSNGPVCKDEHMKEAIQVLKEFFKVEGAKLGASFIRIDPILDDTQSNHEMLKSLELVRAPIGIQAERKWILDITSDTEKLLSEMKKDTRYEIRAGIKKGLQIKSSTSLEDFDKFYEIFKETVERNNFIPQPRWYLMQEFEELAKGDMAKIYWVEFEGQLLASAIIGFYHNSACYLHAGSRSNKEINKLFAPPAIIWQAILDSKEKGLKFFDFWGIAPTDDPAHPWAGLTRFKRSFGGQEWNVMPAYDYPISSKYNIVKYAEKHRNTISKIYKLLGKN